MELFSCSGVGGCIDINAVEIFFSTAVYSAVYSAVIRFLKEACDQGCSYANIKRKDVE